MAQSLQEIRDLIAEFRSTARNARALIYHGNSATLHESLEADAKVINDLLAKFILRLQRVADAQATIEVATAEVERLETELYKRQHEVVEAKVAEEQTLLAKLAALQLQIAKLQGQVRA